MTAPIAITGSSVLSPNGATAEALWDSLLDGVDRRCRWPKRPLEIYPVNNVIPIPETAWRQIEDGHGSRSSAMAELLRETARDNAAFPRRADFRVGCLMASTTSAAEAAENAIASPAQAGATPRTNSGLLPLDASRWSGPTAALSTACSSGLMAPAMAIEILRAGEADAMIAGGLDVLLEYTICGFNSLRVATPEKCRPFSADRKGVVLSEGGACFALEPLAQAQRRGAAVQAVVLGYGISCDADHPTAPSAAGIARAIRAALDMAGISPGQIGGIVAHGTGTPTNDGVEIDALRLAFGTVPLPPLTSLKAAIGHSQAGAGATALAAAIMMLNKGIMPGTASLHEVDPALGDVDVVSSPRAIAQPCLLINAFGFGGNNCVFVVADQALAWRLP